MTTLATLRTDAAEWPARTDIAQAQIDKFIINCEAMIRRDVRIAAMIQSSTLALSAQSVALPTGFLEARSVTLDLDNGRAKLDFLPPERLRESVVFYETGNPIAYTIEGTNLVVAPTPSDSPNAHLVYYKAFDALSDPSDTNTLLTDAYDVYLYGTIAVLCEYTQDFEQEDRYRLKYRAAVERVNTQDRRRKRTGSALISTGVFSP